MEFGADVRVRNVVRALESPMLRISLCMIVRDEAENLERCLRSVAGVVDELCVLDTGSTDGTIELARRLGARVSSAPWTQDFSAARNASVALASGDWILERLAP